MTHDLDSTVTVFAGDSHRWQATVTQDGSALDISNATVSYRLFDNQYDSAEADAVLSDSDSDVDVIDTSPLVDPTAGQFEVRVDENATDGLSGEYWSRFIVDPDGDTRQQFRQRTVVEP